MATVKKTVYPYYLVCEGERLDGPYKTIKEAKHEADCMYGVGDEIEIVQVIAKTIPANAVHVWSK